MASLPDPLDLTDQHTTPNLVVRCGAPKLGARASIWIDRELGTADEIVLPGGPLNLLDPAVLDQALLLIGLHNIKHVWLVEHSHCQDTDRLRDRAGEAGHLADLAGLFADANVSVHAKTFDITEAEAQYVAKHLVWCCSDFRLRHHRRAWMAMNLGTTDIYEVVMPGSGLALQRDVTSPLLHEHLDELRDRGVQHVCDLRHTGCGAYAAFRDAKTPEEQIAAQQTDHAAFADLEVHEDLATSFGILKPSGAFAVPHRGL